MNDNFIKFDRSIFSKRLSFKAIGLYGVICLMIDNGEKITLESLKAKSKEGMTSTRSTLNELIEKGVIIRTAKRGHNGGFGGYDYEINKELIK